jgi:hypothetical protein
VPLLGHEERRQHRQRDRDDEGVQPPLQGVDSPSMAESTETAGVSMASPKNRPAPSMPTISTALAPRPPARWTSAIRDRVPPSPRLSKRISTRTYLRVTITISDQNIREMTPSTSPVASAPPGPRRWAMDSLKA